MTDKRMTQRNRAIAINKIKQQLALLYREDLAELAGAIDEVMQYAPLTPACEKLTAPGEWLEERHVPGKLGKPGRYYVYLRSIDDAGRERGKLIFHGTLAEYKASRQAE